MLIEAWAGGGMVGIERMFDKWAAGGITQCVWKVFEKSFEKRLTKCGERGII